MSARAGIRIRGKDKESFLQNLVTNDVTRLQSGLVWTALLSPQGKYLADFFLVPQGEAILIDVAEPLAADLLKRFSLYRLRADVDLQPITIKVARGEGDAPDGAFADPRTPALGWRAYDGRGGSLANEAALRVAHLVPESGIELIPNDSYPLEMNFEALNGVDFSKGCYVGQEVTARMKHKTALRKGLACVTISDSAAPGTPIIAKDGREAGTLYTRSKDQALAYLRFDRAGAGMRAGDASVDFSQTP